jgi:hypothetical protein
MSTHDTFWFTFSVLFVAISCFPFTGTGRAYAHNLAEYSHIEVSRNTLFLAFLFSTLARAGLTIVLYLVLFEPFRQIALAISLAGLAMITFSKHKEIPGARQLPTGIRIFCADVVLNLDNVILVAILSRKELEFSFQVFMWMLSTCTLIMIWWLVRKELSKDRTKILKMEKKQSWHTERNDVSPLRKFVRSITVESFLLWCWLGGLGWFVGYISVTDTAVAPLLDVFVRTIQTQDVPFISQDVLKWVVAYYPVVVGIITEIVTYSIFFTVLVYRLYFSKKSRGN